MARGPSSELIKQLSAVPLFSSCSKDELRQIASLGTEIRVGPGRELTRQGESGSEFFLVVSGELTCEKDGRPLDRIKAGDYFGELALLTKGPRSATIVSDSDTVLRVFDRREFASLLEDAPGIARKLLTVMAERTVPGPRS
jgi:CRP-like cAMP-binding protein